MIALQANRVFSVFSIYAQLLPYKLEAHTAENINAGLISTAKNSRVLNGEEKRGLKGNELWPYKLRVRISGASVDKPCFHSCLPSYSKGTTKGSYCTVLEKEGGINGEL